MDSSTRWRALISEPLHRARLGLYPRPNVCGIPTTTTSALPGRIRRSPRDPRARAAERRSQLSQGALICPDPEILMWLELAHGLVLIGVRSSHCVRKAHPAVSPNTLKQETLSDLCLGDFLWERDVSPRLQGPSVFGTYFGHGA